MTVRDMLRRERERIDTRLLMAEASIARFFTAWTTSIGPGTAVHRR